MTKDESLVGKVVHSFRFEELLGKGGMGNVYLGRHETIGSKVAIKVLHPEYVSDASMERRFLDEARAVNKVEHPGLVKINDCGREDGVGVFLVMELLNGRTLRDKLKQDGPLPPPEVVRIVGQVISALEAVHRVGIVHRDLKPENIMLIPDPYVTGGERVKILDFGIAKLLEDGARIGENTKTGHIFGSPFYMSPEQCADTKSVDQRTDIYALGVIAYELVCGSPPFVADSIYDLVRKHLTTRPALPRSRSHQVPEAMGRAVLKALAFELDERYQNVAAFGAALEASLEGLPASETMQWGAAAERDGGAGDDVAAATAKEQHEDEEGLGGAPTMLAADAKSVGVITTDPPMKLKQPEGRQAAAEDDTAMASSRVDSDGPTVQPAQETLPVIGEVATDDVPPGAGDGEGEAGEEDAPPGSAGPTDTVASLKAPPSYRRLAVPAGVALAGVAVVLMLSQGGKEPDRREDPVKLEAPGAARTSGKTSSTEPPPIGARPVPTTPVAKDRAASPAVAIPAPDAGQPLTPVASKPGKKARSGKVRTREGRRSPPPAVVARPALVAKPGPAPVEKTRPAAAAASPPARKPGTDFRYRKISPRPTGKQPEKKGLRYKGLKKDHRYKGLKKDLRYRRIKSDSKKK